jgi:hypothetical protein
VVFQPRKAERSGIFGAVEGHVLISILCMGWRTVGPAVAWDLVQTSLAAELSQAVRHLRRLGKVAVLDAKRNAPQPQRSDP